jgi:hypothetical protein
MTPRDLLARMAVIRGTQDVTPAMLEPALIAAIEEYGAEVRRASCVEPEPSISDEQRAEKFIYDHAELFHPHQLEVIAPLASLLAETRHAEREWLIDQLRRFMPETVDFWGEANGNEQLEEFVRALPAQHSGEQPT